MRRFGTQGPVNPQEHYVVSRTEEIADFIKRVKEGRYVVFDHREEPEPRVETETIEGLTIRSYIIPMMQELPSKVQNASETQ